MTVPKEIRSWIAAIGSPHELKFRDRGRRENDNGQVVFDIINRYTAFYLDDPNLRMERPDWELNLQQRQILMHWLKEDAPNGIREYRDRVRRDDSLHLSFQPEREAMEVKILRLFPEAYEVIFKSD